MTLAEYYAGQLAPSQALSDVLRLTTLESLESSDERLASYVQNVFRVAQAMASEAARIRREDRGEVLRQREVMREQLLAKVGPEL